MARLDSAGASASARQSPRSLIGDFASLDPPPEGAGQADSTGEPRPPLMKHLIRSSSDELPQSFLQTSQFLR